MIKFSLEKIQNGFILEAITGGLWQGKREVYFCKTIEEALFHIERCSNEVLQKPKEVPE